MMTESRLGTRLGTLAVLAVAAGLAVSVSGCVIDSTSTGGGYCAPDLLVDWQLVDSNNVPVTCAAAGVATVQATVNGTAWSQTCLPNESFDTIDVPLAATGHYTVSVDAFDSGGAARETQAQTIDLQIIDCGTSRVPSPAVLTIAN